MTAGLTRLVVVGLGRQGSRHARIARQTEGVELAATVDPFATGTPGVPHFDKVADALDAVDAEAAIVATPTSEHGPVVAELLEARVPTLVEKPLAAAVDEAEVLVGEADRRGVLLAVGYVERFNPAVALVAAMLRRGSLGRPITLSFRRVGLAPPSWPGVDVVHDLAVHDIDVFQLLSGAAPRLVAASGWPAQGLAESAHLLVEAGGVGGALTVNWRTPVRLRDFTVTTETCYVEADYTTQKVEVVEPTTHTDFVEFDEFRSHYGSARRVQLEARPAEPLAEQLRAFVAAVRGDRPPLLASGREGIESLRIAHRASREMVRA